MSQPIQTPEPGEALRAAFKLRGRVRPALEEFIVPTINLGDVGQGQPPGTPRAAWGHIFVGAVAAEYARWRLEIPERTIAHVTAIHIRPATAGTLRIKNQNVPGVVNTSQQARLTDERLVDTGEDPAATFIYGTDVNPLTNFNFATWAPVTGLIFRPSWLVIGTGEGSNAGSVAFGFDTANVACFFGLEWTEYPIV